MIKYHLQKFRVKWLMLKIYDENEITFGCYNPRKKSITNHQKQNIVVEGFHMRSD